MEAKPRSDHKAFDIKAAFVKHRHLLEAAYDGFEVDITTKETNPDLVSRIKGLQAMEHDGQFRTIDATRTANGVVTVKLVPSLRTVIDNTQHGTRPINLTDDQWGAIAMLYQWWNPNDAVASAGQSSTPGADL